MYKLVEKSSVDDEIIREINMEVREIEKEISEISEIMTDLSLMIGEQAEGIQISVEHVEHAKEEVEDSVNHLKESVKYTDKRKQLIKNAVLIFTATDNDYYATGSVAAGKVLTVNLSMPYNKDYDVQILAADGVTVLASGISLGALGFIAGPIVGAITLVTGTATGGTIAFLTK